MIDLAFFSNGHGEDTIACKVLDVIRAKRPDLTVEAWPMVGEGGSYRARDVPIEGAFNLLPSAGFATISPKLMAGDLQAGWVKTHWRQFQAARGMKGRYRMAVAVGDIVPMLGAIVSRTPFTFIGCAKSYYYNPRRAYTQLERKLLARFCTLTFPRDRKTIPELERAGVRTLYLGNPMMDGLEPGGNGLGLGNDDIAIGMLAGTRADADANMLDLLETVLCAHAHFENASQLRFVFAARPGLDAGKIAGMIAADRRLADLRVSDKVEGEDASGVVLRLSAPGGVEVIVAKDRFADVLHASSVVVGMAGTANEQAIGLGKPLVAVPSAGVQGDEYVRMKGVFFGEAAVTVPRDPNAICRAVADILADPDKQARMAAAGRERMGEPGASEAIADAVLNALDALPAKAAA